MRADGLLHINIRCADLERTRDFYEKFVGLTAGDRPPFQSVGYWLYVDGAPMVHLTQRGPAETVHAGSGNIDHIAFRGGDFAGTRDALRDAGLPFRETTVPRDGTRQIFVVDPNGIQIELSFAPVRGPERSAECYS